MTIAAINPSPPRPQPFWTSKTFWVLSFGIALHIARATGKLPVALQSESAEIINMIIDVLGICFRWTSTQPLTSDPTATVLPPVSPGDH